MIRTPRQIYSTQKRCAGQRGISFLLSFNAWWAIWQESGHWHERGRNRDQYVMARYGDKGPYKTGNVKIITVKENCSEGQLGRVHTEEHRRKAARFRFGSKRSKETRRKMSLARIGIVYSEETCRRISAAKKGVKLSKEHRRKISEGGMGRVTSIETRRKLSIALKRHHAELRAQ